MPINMIPVWKSPEMGVQNDTVAAVDMDSKQRVQVNLTVIHDRILDEGTIFTLTPLQSDHQFFTLTNPQRLEEPVVYLDYASSPEEEIVFVGTYDGYISVKKPTTGNIFLTYTDHSDMKVPLTETQETRAHVDFGNLYAKLQKIHAGQNADICSDLEYVIDSLLFQEKDWEPLEDEYK